MVALSIEQYEYAVKQLSPRHIEALQVLYYLPNSSATAKQLAEIIHPTNPAPITASGRIGKIGKAIAAHCKTTPETYFDGTKERPAYFKLVSEYYFTDIGWTLNKNLKRAIENLKLVDDDDSEVYERLSTETLPFDEVQHFKEGKVVPVFVDRYERNQKARLECIKHYGDQCFVCSFNFGSTYGDIAKGFIHVHHNKELSSIGREYNVDPIKDLIPLCANCHSVIHLTKPAMSVDELKRLRKKTKG